MQLAVAAVTQTDKMYKEYVEWPDTPTEGIQQYESKLFQISILRENQNLHIKQAQLAPWKNWILVNRW